MIKKDNKNALKCVFKTSNEKTDDNTYEKDINIIKNWLETKENLTAIGRSGMFKYNNQDHAMATGLYAVRNLLGEGNFDPWSVNVDGEYQEEISNN